MTVVTVSALASSEEDGTLGRLDVGNYLRPATLVA
jgi:hypothetical protein